MNVPRQQAAIESLTFSRRPESWVAISGERFYKVPRRSDDPVLDAGDPACIAAAESEYRHASLLAEVEPAVLRPLSLHGACLVYPAISGPDMRDFLFSSHRRDAEVALTKAMRTLAGLSSAPKTSLADLEEYGVEQPFYLEPGVTLRHLMASRYKSLVIDGFEVRNFRFDASTDTWRFFDPHGITVGHHECNIARFVVSLLMLSWGRSAKCWMWTAFDLGKLIAEYESASRSVVHAGLLRYFLAENVAMRDFFAKKTIGQMRRAVRPAARAYRAIFFMQLKWWVNKIGY